MRVTGVQTQDAVATIANLKKVRCAEKRTTRAVAARPDRYDPRVQVPKTQPYKGIVPLVEHDVVARTLRMAVASAMGNTPLSAVATSTAGPYIDAHAALLRQAIREGKYTPQAFCADVEKLGEGIDFDALDCYAHHGLDFPHLDRDRFAQRLFRAEECKGKERKEYGDGAGQSYHYVPSQVSSTLDMIKQVPMSRHTVVYDIGCGRGQPAMLLGWITGAQVIGVEFNKAYCQHARKTVSELGLKNVDIVQADALKLDYSKGDVFHMYAPFVDDMLDRFLFKNLRPVARQKQITIVFHGPNYQQLKRKRWLEEVASNPERPYDNRVFRSRKEFCQSGDYLSK